MDDNKNGFRIKRVHILAAILLLLLIYLAVGLYRAVQKDKDFRERVANGELNNYHNQPSNEFGAPIVYFRTDIERIVGVRLRESEEKIGGYKCTKYWNNRNDPHHR